MNSPKDDAKELIDHTVMRFAAVAPGLFRELLNVLTEYEFCGLGLRKKA